MDLPFWRDLSLVLLTAEVFLVCLPILIILYLTIKGMICLKAKVGHRLPLIRGKVEGTERIAKRVSAILGFPVIRGYALAAGLCGGAGRLISMVKGRGPMGRRVKGLIMGGLIGAFLGMATAWFLQPKSLNDEVREGTRREEAVFNRIRPYDLLRLGLSILGIVRQIADLRRRS